jgi:hypothetical protein
MGRTSRAPKKPFFVVRDDRLVRIDPFPAEPTVEPAEQAPGDEHGGLLRRAKEFLRGHLRTYRVAAQAKRARAGSDRLRDPFCRPFPGVPPDLLVWAPEYPPEYAAAWDVTARLIGELRNETASRGQRFAVIYIPSRGQVLPGAWERSLECWPAAAQLPWDREKVNHLLSDLLVRLDTPFLDLTEPFRQMASAGQSPFLRTDWHLNVLGHRRLAALLTEWLADSSLISQR